MFANLEKFAAAEAEKGRAKVVPHKGNWKDVVQGLIGKEKFSGFHCFQEGSYRTFEIIHENRIRNSQSFKVAWEVIS